MPGTILLVDDEEQLRKLLSRIISLEGFTVVEANSLKSATQILAHQPIDVVLCDVRLPDGNGVEFIKVVKDKYPSLDMLLLTANGNLADGVQAMKTGLLIISLRGMIMTASSRYCTRHWIRRGFKKNWL